MIGIVLGKKVGLLPQAPLATMTFIDELGTEHASAVGDIFLWNQGEGSVYNQPCQLLFAGVADFDGVDLLLRGAVGGRCCFGDCRTFYWIPE